jgi:hypothetical protein
MQPYNTGATDRQIKMWVWCPTNYKIANNTPNKEVIRRKHYKKVRDLVDIKHNSMQQQTWQHRWATEQKVQENNNRKTSGWTTIEH